MAVSKGKLDQDLFVILETEAFIDERLPDEWLRHGGPGRTVTINIKEVMGDSFGNARLIRMIIQRFEANGWRVDYYVPQGAEYGNGDLEFS